ncbi:MAG: phenylalanine--tRNA ligase subunit beta [Muribaculaceae bacterium]|nr:phenylalanine--tRNA ligase subunit beta [Muribaculaceae bacterium]
MNISYKWLKEYVDLELTPDGLSELLTSIGLEVGTVERVESIRGGLAGIVVGKVLTCEAHPDSDHLHITTVDLDGKGTPTQIVCGAPNVAAGQTVVVATVGTTLYSPDGDSFKIKKSKIRGVESFGMICAEDEIGVGNSHDGIIVLPAAAEAMVGRPASEYFGIEDDYVLEVDLTPNRIDAASHFGVARDVAAALTGRGIAEVTAHKPSVDDFKVDDPAGKGITVSIEAPEAVTRYCGITIEGVKTGPSPDWLVKRLTSIGMHSINNVVDITNYILHAVCQPLHAFDADTLAENKVVVRRADHGSKFVTLDEVERTLDGADLMICDAHTPRCIAGVFGGLNSGTTESTTRIFLESACFNATSVRRTARRHGINTDSSFRFERGVDPNGCLYALKLAAKLICELTGGHTVGEIVDYYPAPVAPYHVDMNIADFSSLIGVDFDHDAIVRILKALEIGTTLGADGALSLDVPTYRMDVQRPCDVIEDFLRIYGYNEVPMSSQLHSCLSFKTPVDAADDLRRTVAEQLTGAGWNEILNNSLTAESYYAELADYPLDRCVRLLNPLSQDLCVMRQTLLFGGLESVAHNINRRNPDTAFYEFGNVYFRDPAKASTSEAPLAPYSEASHLALWLAGSTRRANWLRAREDAGFYDLKAAVANVLARCGFGPADYSLAPAQVPAGGIFAQALEIRHTKGAVLGMMGIVSPAVCKACDIKVPVSYAELDWDSIARLAARTNARFTPLPKTQAVKRDLSLLLDSKVSMADIEAAVREAERRILGDIELFDVYEGDKLPAGKKSYAISITLQDPEKTLQDKYIDRVMAKIIDTLRSKLGAELR